MTHFANVFMTMADTSPAMMAPTRKPPSTTFVLDFPMSAGPENGLIFGLSDKWISGQLTNRKQLDKIINNCKNYCKGSRKPVNLDD